jgi:hypothetical protein
MLRNGQLARVLIGNELIDVLFGHHVLVDVEGLALLLFLPILLVVLEAIYDVLCLVVFTIM